MKCNSAGAGCKKFTLICSIDETLSRLEEILVKGAYVLMHRDLLVYCAPVQMKLSVCAQNSAQKKKKNQHCVKKINENAIYFQSFGFSVCKLQIKEHHVRY